MLKLNDAVSEFGMSRVLVSKPVEKDGMLRRSCALAEAVIDGIVSEEEGRLLELASMNAETDETAS